MKAILQKLNSLSQESRLKAFRLLVKVGSEGLSAGKISEKLSIPSNTLSFHLAHLSNANLLKSYKDGRSIIYSVNFKAVESLIKFLLENCCIDSDNKACITKNFTNKLN